jgi:hypothetical protein
MIDAPPHFGTMLFLIEADGTFEAIGFAGADIVALDGEIIEVLAERERRKKQRKRNAADRAERLKPPSVFLKINAQWSYA